MKLALAYSTKDKLHLTKQTWPILLKSVEGKADLYWCDGSDDKEAEEYAWSQMTGNVTIDLNIRGGADAAIVYKLTKLLENRSYTHVGLLENDVLLDYDWLDATMDLFDRGYHEGLMVGAVSPRAYEDRILVQRKGYALMHNLGAGAIIFQRQAAEIALRWFRNGWWSDNRQTFAALAGIDIGTYGAFRFGEQQTTTDWAWEVFLAQHGMAALALTPSRATMVGQVPSLKEQGLTLVDVEREKFRDDKAFDLFKRQLDKIAQLRMGLTGPGMLRRSGENILVFPHQLGRVYGRYRGPWKLRWTQHWGPFSYVADEGGASCSLHVGGLCSFHISGGDKGAFARVTDETSGFCATPPLQPMAAGMAVVTVPGGNVPRKVTLELSEGGMFHAVDLTGAQLYDPTFRFDYSVLPKV